MAGPVYIVVASGDAALTSLASEGAGDQWQVECCSKLTSAEEFLARPELKLILFDDQILGYADSSSALVQLRERAPHAPPASTTTPPNRSTPSASRKSSGRFSGSGYRPSLRFSARPIRGVLHP